MKKLLVLVYVLVVASLSISARAESNVPLLIDSVQHIENANLIQVTGEYPNPCITNPVPALSQDKEGRLVLDVLGTSTAEICIQIVGPKFMLGIDLNVLKADIEALGLDTNAVHKIHHMDGEVIAEVNFAKIFHPISFETTEISGLLLAEESGLYVHGPLGARIKVKSMLHNLDSLHNQEVTLTGHMMTHSVSRPVFRTNTATPQFIATGVSFSIAD